MESTEYNLSQLDSASKELFSLLDSQFVDFNPTYNVSQVSLPFPRSHSLRNYLPLHPSLPWGVTYQYIPTNGSYGCTELTTPGANGHKYIFRRPLSIPGIFLPIISDGTLDIEELSEDKARNTPAISPNLIATILKGNALPLDFMSQTQPDSINSRLAAMKDRSKSWSSKDAVVIPVCPDITLDITRKFMFAPRPGNSSIELTAVKSTVNNDGTRNQIVINFGGNRYWVRPPEIYGQVLEPAPLFLTDDAKVINRYTPRMPKVELIGSMAKMIVDILA